MSDKPVIFISHSSKDGNLASVIQEQIVNALRIDKRDVFLSTDPQTIPVGSDWFKVIEQGLNKANCLIVIVSPSSVESIWVGYEIGYFWHKTGGQENIYPLVVPNTQIKGPIERLQYKSLADTVSLSAFFEGLCRRFSKTYVPKNINLEKMVESAREDVVGEHIKQVIKERLYFEYEPGAQIWYSQWDRELGLPRGATQKYLPEVTGGWTVDEGIRNSAGTAVYPPPSPSNPPGDPF